MDFFYDKRVLITGHTGFKGSWLTKILLMYGANVLGYSLANDIDSSIYKLLNLENQIKSVIGDIRDFNKLKDTIVDFKPEIIIHLAAISTVEKANENPLDVYEINVLGTVNLLESIKYCDSVKSVLFVSTDSVYEKIGNKYIYTEEDKIKGYNSYSISKSCAELIIKNYKENYFNFLDYPRISVTRSVNVIGGGDLNNSRIIPTCINAWLNNTKIELKNPKNVRPFLYILETLYGYLLLAKLQYLNKEIEGIYNFSPNREEYISIGELVLKFCDKLQINNNMKNTEKNTNIYEISNKKAKEKLNWEPILNIDQKLDKIIKWHKALINNEDIVKLTEQEINEFFNKVKI